MAKPKERRSFMGWTSENRTIWAELLSADFSPWKLIELSYNAVFQRRIGSQLWTRPIWIMWEPDQTTKGAMQKELSTHDDILSPHLHLIDRGRDVLEIRSDIIDHFDNYQHMRNLQNSFYVATV